MVCSIWIGDGQDSGGGTEDFDAGARPGFVDGVLGWNPWLALTAYADHPFGFCFESPDDCFLGFVDIVAVGEVFGGH